MLLTLNNLKEIFLEVIEEKKLLKKQVLGHTKECKKVKWGL